MTAMLILVDMDDTLADFDAGFVASWRAQFPAEPFVLPDDRRSFYLSDDYPAHLHTHVESIYHAPGFFRSLPPMRGGLDAVRAMVAHGHQVFICTAPIVRYEHCVLEKFEWVAQHLGRACVARIVLTYDKTLVRGDVLIDDRPEFKGAFAPLWEHVLFDRPYNRWVTGKRRLDWTNWREVLRL